jgi:hypothetical protein
MTSEGHIIPGVFYIVAGFSAGILTQWDFFKPKKQGEEPYHLLLEKDFYDIKTKKLEGSRIENIKGEMKHDTPTQGILLSEPQTGGGWWFRNWIGFWAMGVFLATLIAFIVTVSNDNQDQTHIALYVSYTTPALFLMWDQTYWGIIATMSIALTFTDIIMYDHAFNAMEMNMTNPDMTPNQAAARNPTHQVLFWFSLASTVAFLFALLLRRVMFVAWYLVCALGVYWCYVGIVLFTPTGADINPELAYAHGILCAVVTMLVYGGAFFVMDRCIPKYKDHKINLA